MRSPAAAVLALLLLACGSGTSLPPNVVLVVVDTLRADHLSVYGYPRATSPHLEQLARESVVFDNAFTVMSHTLPAHVSLVTGVHPATHGVLSNGWVYDGAWPTLATRLRDAGYASAAFVSGFPLDRSSGFGRGFEVFEDTRVDGEPHSKVEGELTNRRALAWLRKQGDWPFFLLVHYYDLHTPYTWPGSGPLPLPVDAALEAELRRTGAAGLELSAVNPKPLHFRGRELGLLEAANLYDNLVLRVDGLIEELRAELQELGLLDHTLLVITADHGEGLGQHAYWSHGLHLYEEQLHVPLIVRPPRGAGAGWEPGRVEAVVSLLDVAPSVLELAHLPSGDLTQGRSLRAARGERAAPRWLVAQRRRFSDGYQQSWGRFAASADLVALRGDGPLKYLRDGDGNQELYDLDADPLERHNLAAERPAQAAELSRVLDQQLAALGASEPVPEQEVDADTRRRLEELGYAR